MNAITVSLLDEHVKGILGSLSLFPLEDVDFTADADDETSDNRYISSRDTQASGGVVLRVHDKDEILLEDDDNVQVIKMMTFRGGGRAVEVQN